MSIKDIRRLCGIDPVGPTLHGDDDNALTEVNDMGGGDISHVRARQANMAAAPNRDVVMNNPIDRPFAHNSSHMPPDVSVAGLKKLAGIGNTGPEASPGFLDEVRKLADESIAHSRAIANRMALVGRPDPRVEQDHIAQVKAKVDAAKTALKELAAACQSVSGMHISAANDGAHYVAAPSQKMMNPDKEDAKPNGSAWS